MLPRPLEIRRITTVVPQRDRSTASFGSHRHGNGLRSNREIVGRSRLVQNDSDLPQGLKATIAGTVAREGGWHLDAAFGEQGSRDQVAANPGLIWQRGDVP